MTSVLIKRGDQDTDAQRGDHVGTQGGHGICTQEGGPGRTSPAGAWTSDLQPAGLGQSRSVWCNPTGCGALLCCRADGHSRGNSAGLPCGWGLGAEETAPLTGAEWMGKEGDYNAKCHFLLSET